MIQVNIHEAKTHLSRYAKMVKKGATVILCDRNKPFAEIRPLGQPEYRPLKLGVAKGDIIIADDFDAPLVEFERDFYGNNKK